MAGCALACHSVVRIRALAASVAMLSWAIVFFPQTLVWHSVYGQWLTVPQGGSFMQWTSPHPFAVLFDKHGLLSWTPLILVALVGLVRFARTHVRVALPIAAIVLSAWYVNSAVADWWAGEAFGARRFLSLYPLLVLGLAVWVDGSRHSWRVVLVALLVAL